VKILLTIAVSLALTAFAGCESPSLVEPPQTGARRIVAFQATWCAPCRRDKPALAEIEQTVPVTHIDADAQPDLVRQHGIDAFPTYILYLDGREVLRTSDMGVLSRFLQENQ
jgi:thiol-disulfide isomerase/thioredoxin